MMRNFILLLSFACFFGSTFGTLEAQGLRSAKAIQQEIENKTKDLKQRLKAKMDVHLEEVQRLTEIDGKQLKKLQIAAKGLVSKSARSVRDRWTKCSDALAAMEPFDVTTAYQLIEKSIGEIGSMDAAQTPQWKSVLGKNLSEEQLAKLNASEASRQQQHQAALFGVLANILNEEMLLSAAQRDSLAELLQTQFKDEESQEEKLLEIIVLRADPFGFDFFVDGQDDATDDQKKQFQQFEASVVNIIGADKKTVWESEPRGWFGPLFDVYLENDDEDAGFDEMMGPSPKKMVVREKVKFPHVKGYVAGVCELSEDEAEKLSAVLASQFNEWVKEAEALQFEAEKFGGDMDDDSSIEDEDKMDELFEKLENWKAFTESSRLNDAIKSSVSKAAFEKYKKEIESRKQLDSAGMVELIVSAFDEKLLMEKETRGKFKAIVEKHVEEEMENFMAFFQQWDSFQDGPMFFAFDGETDDGFDESEMMRDGVDSDPSVPQSKMVAELKELLTPAQKVVFDAECKTYFIRWR